ncbi:MAG: chemotaxis protein CheW [Verrucomicrobiae bacterium]
MTPPAQLIEFFIGERRYACDLLWVREILLLPAITPVDCAPDYCPGLIHIRGQILTAINLETRLGYPQKPGSPTARCIVFKTGSELARLAQIPDEAHMADSDPNGILVDKIGDILTLETQILPAPPKTLSGLDPACIAGVLHGASGLTTVLHIGPIITPK